LLSFSYWCSATHDRSGSSILTYITVTIFMVSEAEGRGYLRVQDLYIMH